MDNTTIYSWIPGAVAFLPLVAQLAVLALGQRRAAARDAVLVATSGAAAILALTMWPHIAAGRVLVSRIVNLVPPLRLSFRVDTLGFFVTCVAAFVWFLVAVYAVGYMRGEHNQTRFYVFFLLGLSGALGTFVAGDLFTMFLFFELVSITAYVLVVHEGTPKAMQAGLKYIFMTLLSSLGFFFALVATERLGGTLDLGQVGLIKEASPLALGAFIGFLVAFGLKAGLVPLHVWLSDAHPVAPSPASALLSGIMLKTGAYGLFRVVFNVFGGGFFSGVGWLYWVQVAAAVTIVLGSAVAVTQTDLKRRLAYSSVGQMGYIALGITLLTEWGVTGAVFHVFTHAVVKSLLFLSAGSIIRQTGLRDVRDLGGVSSRLPVTMACFTVGALTITGIPPMNGFLSEWCLMRGSLAAGRPVFAVLLLLSSLMNAAYYLPIVISAYFGKPKTRVHIGEVHEEHGVVTHVTTEAPPPIIPHRRLEWLREAPATMLVPMLVLAVGCILFAFLPTNWPLAVSGAAARTLLGL